MAEKKKQLLVTYNLLLLKVKEAEQDRLHRQTMSLLKKYKI